MQRKLNTRGGPRGAVVMAAALLAGLTQGMASAAPVGHYNIAGQQGDFEVGQCVVVEIPGKGEKLQLVGSSGELSVNISSNNLSRDHDRVQQASVRLDRATPAYAATFRLKDGTWSGPEDERQAGPLVHLSPGRVVVEGPFLQLGPHRGKPPVHGRIEADCPTLDADKVARLRGEAAPAPVGEPSGMARIGGREASFVPEACTLMKLGERGHILSLQGQGDAVGVRVNDMRQSDGGATQSVQIGFKDNNDQWTAARVQEAGEWKDTQDQPAPGPLVVIDGTRIAVEGEFSRHGSEERRHARVEANCPNMATFSGS